MNVIEKIHQGLTQLAKNPNNIKDYSRFHKDGKVHIGLVSPLETKAASKYFKEIKNLEKKKVFALCEELLEMKGIGYRGIAFDWAMRLRKKYQKEDFKIFESWLTKYVNTWGSCDDLCTHAFGECMYQFPECLPKVKQWTKSKNTWLRRASAVVLIYSLRKGKYLNEAIATAQILLKDDEDLVQKGYGWMLKEASNLYPKEVFDFVMKNKNAMPRTALRYAIEKLPQKMRTEAMKTR